MTIDEAGNYYLTYVCPHNAAWDHFDQVLFRGHKRVYARELHGRHLRKVRKALTRLRNAAFNEGRAWLNPPSEWPNAESASATGQMARNDLRESQLETVLRTKEGRGFVRYWNYRFVPVVNGFDQSLAYTARAALNLPAPGSGC
jgi:hypothetical protein